VKVTGVSAGWDPQWWPAPAKLNLMLHITGRRADGYHLLQTLFQFLDWGDELQFFPQPDAAIVLQTPTPGVPPADDLIVQAATRLQQQTGYGGGVRIAVRKRIPAGGGLGGGSSDAATTLVALNQLWGLGMDTQQLQHIGLQLGADVPVFVAGCAAWAEGVGEQLQCVEPPQPWYLVLDPGVQVATRDVFMAADLTRNTPAGKMADFVRSGGHNDCEPVVRRSYPDIGAALDWLSGFSAARLTGTGACVFAAFEHRLQAQSVLAQLPDGWRAQIARGINRSPLLMKLDAGSEQ
jgi:4-diphosphocytidyl-2-C-methyl-D-erythritol kinase